jgi:protein TonB
VPDEAPKEMPKIDYSQSYARADVDVSGAGSISGIGGGTGGPAGAAPIQQSSATTIHDFSFSQIEITFKPADPTWPPLARASRTTGTVMVQVVIGPDGIPTSAKAISGPPILHKASEDYAKKWRFKPALEDGRPVSGAFKLNVNWQ